MIKVFFDKVQEVKEALGNDPERPKFWGGFKLIPLEIEFWSDGENVCMIGLGGTDVIVKVSGWSTDFTHRHDFFLVLVSFLVCLPY